MAAPAPPTKIMIIRHGEKPPKQIHHGNKRPKHGPTYSLRITPLTNHLVQAPENILKIRVALAQHFVHRVASA